VSLDRVRDEWPAGIVSRHTDIEWSLGEKYLSIKVCEFIQKL